MTTAHNPESASTTERFYRVHVIKSSMTLPYRSVPAISTSPPRYHALTSLLGSTSLQRFPRFLIKTAHNPLRGNVSHIDSRDCQLYDKRYSAEERILRTMTPIIAIIGRSKSGKTSLIEQLIPELIKRGYRVATIKHHDQDFTIDQEGKDTWRHKQAGAQSVIISSPRKVAVIEDSFQDLSLDELVVRLSLEADIIIAEGFKRDRHPKIEVFRQEGHSQPLATELKNVIAVVTDVPLLSDIPCVSPADITTIADIIEEQVISAFV